MPQELYDIWEKAREAEEKKKQEEERQRQIAEQLSSVLGAINKSNNDAFKDTRTDNMGVARDNTWTNNDANVQSTYGYGINKMEALGIGGGNPSRSGEIYSTGIGDISPASESYYQRAAQNLYNKRGEEGAMAGIAKREQEINDSYQARRDAKEEGVPENITPYYQTLKSASTYQSPIEGEKYTYGNKTISKEEADRINAATNKYNATLDDYQNGKASRLELYKARQDVSAVTDPDGAQPKTEDEQIYDRAYAAALKSVNAKLPSYKEGTPSKAEKTIYESELAKAFEAAIKAEYTAKKATDKKKYNTTLQVKEAEAEKETTRETDLLANKLRTAESENAKYLKSLGVVDQGKYSTAQQATPVLSNQALKFNPPIVDTRKPNLKQTDGYLAPLGGNALKAIQSTTLNTAGTQGHTNKVVSQTIEEYANDTATISAAVKAGNKSTIKTPTDGAKEEVASEKTAQAASRREVIASKQDEWIKTKMSADEFTSAKSAKVKYTYTDNTTGDKYTDKDYLAYGGSVLPGYDQYVAFIKDVQERGTYTGGLKDAEAWKAYDNLLYYLDSAKTYYSATSASATKQIDTTGINARYEAVKAKVDGGDTSAAARAELRTAETYRNLITALNDYDEMVTKDPNTVYSLQSLGKKTSTFDDKYMTDQEYATYTYLVGLYGDKAGSLARSYLDSISATLTKRAAAGNTNPSAVRSYNREQKQVADSYVSQYETDTTSNQNKYVNLGKTIFQKANPGIDNAVGNALTYNNDGAYTQYNVLEQYINKPGTDRDGINADLETVSKMYGNDNAADALWYIIGKYGVDEGNKYAETLSQYYAKANASKLISEYEDASGIGKFALGTYYGAQQFAKNITAVQNKVQSGEDYLPVIISNDYAIPQIKATQTKGESFGLDAAMNLGQNAIPAAVALATGGLSSASGVAISQKAVEYAVTGLFAADVFGGTYNDMVLQGYSNKQAATAATLTALSETGLQVVLGGLGHLAGATSVATKLGKYLGEFGKYAATSAGGQAVFSWVGMMAARVPAEAVEEFTQALIEPVIKYASTGEWDWADDQVRQAFYSGALGALNSFLLGMSSDTYRSFVGYENLNNIGTEIQNSENGTKNLIAAAKASTNKYIQDYATALEAKVNNGTAKAADIGELYSRVSDAAIAAEAEKTTATTEIFKKNSANAAAYYQAVADGNTEAAEKILKSTVENVAESAKAAEKTFGGTVESAMLNVQATAAQNASTMDGAMKTASAVAGVDLTTTDGVIAALADGMSAEQANKLYEMYSAYKAGDKIQKVAPIKREAESQTTETATVEESPAAKGNVTVENKSNLPLSQSQTAVVDVAKTVSEATGANVIVHEGTVAKSAIYDPAAKVLHTNLNGTENTITKSAVSEYVNQLKTTDTQAYEDMSDYAVSKMGSEAFDKAVANKIKAAKAVGVTLTNAQAEDAVVADVVESTLQSRETAKELYSLYPDAANAAKKYFNSYAATVKRAARDSGNAAVEQSYKSFNNSVKGFSETLRLAAEETKAKAETNIETKAEPISEKPQTVEKKTEAIAEKANVISTDSSTGEIIRDGGFVYKNTTRSGYKQNRGNPTPTIEAEVYDALKGNPNILDGELVDYNGENKIKTPFAKIIISVDTVAKEKRESIGRSSLASRLDDVVNAVNSLSNAGYTYGDPLQFALVNGKLKLMDFSNADKANIKDAINDNYQYLYNFLNAFGLTRYADILSQGMWIQSELQDYSSEQIANGDMLAEPEEIKIVQQAAKAGVKANNAYFSTNGRAVQTKTRVGQTQTDDAVYVFSESPLSKAEIDEWELKPIYEQPATVAKTETDAKPESVVKTTKSVRVPAADKAVAEYYGTGVKDEGTVVYTQTVDGSPYAFNTKDMYGSAERYRFDGLVMRVSADTINSIGKNNEIKVTDKIESVLRGAQSATDLIEISENAERVAPANKHSRAVILLRANDTTIPLYESTAKILDGDYQWYYSPSTNRVIVKDGKSIIAIAKPTLKYTTDMANRAVPYSGGIFTAAESTLRQTISAMLSDPSLSTNQKDNMKAQVWQPLKSQSGAVYEKAGTVGLQDGRTFRVAEQYAEDTIADFEEAKAAADKAGFMYNTVSKKGGVIRFESAVTFDTDQTPTVGRYFEYNTVDGSTATGDSTDVIHNKWALVDSDYAGFDAADNWNYYRNILNQVDGKLKNDSALYEQQLSRNNVNLNHKASETVSSAYEAMEDRWAITETEGKDLTPHSAREVIDILKKIMAVRVGKVQKGAIGQYNEDSETIRLRYDNDFVTALHEYGHHLDKQYKFSTSQFADYLQNRVPTDWALTIHNQGKSVSAEGFAEYVRKTISDPDKAKAENSALYSHVMDNLSKQDLKTFNDLTKAAVGYLSQNMSERIDAHMVGMDESEREQKLRKLKENIKRPANLVNDLAEIKRMESEAKKQIGGELNHSRYKTVVVQRNMDSEIAYRQTEKLVSMDGRSVVLNDSIKRIMDDMRGYNKTKEERKEFKKNVAHYLLLKRDQDIVNIYPEYKTFGADIGLNSRTAVQAKIDELEQINGVKEIAERVWAYYRAVLVNYTQKSGAMSETAVKKMLENQPHYVAFFREQDYALADSLSGKMGNMGGVGGPSIKRLSKVGSGLRIINPLDSIFKQTENMMREAMTLSAMKDVCSMAEYENTTLGSYIERVSPDYAMTQLSTNSVKQTVLKYLGDRDISQEEIDALDANWGSAVGDFVDQFKAKKGQTKGIIALPDGDTTKYYQLSDFMLEAIYNMTPQQMNQFVAFAMQAKSVFSATVTSLKPSFATKNPVRDFQTAMINTESSVIKFIGNYFKAIPLSLRQLAISASGNKTAANDITWDIQSKEDVAKLTRTQKWEIYRAMGGGAQSVGSAEGRNFINAVSKRAISGRRGAIVSIVDAMYATSEAGESTPRFAKFDEVLTATGDLTEAMYAAMEVTTNFKIKSGNAAVKAVSAFVPFFNPGIQGLYKAIRVWSGADAAYGKRAQAIARGVSKTILYAMPEILGTVLYALSGDDKDDDEYKYLSAYVRNNYWNIPLKGEGNYLKLPKAQVYGAFPTLMKAFVEYYFKDNEMAMYGMASYLFDQFLPNGVPNPFKENNEIETEGTAWLNKFFSDITYFGAIVNVLTNEDYKGTPIVPPYMLGSGSTQSPGVDKALQYTESTTAFAKFLADVANWATNNPNTASPIRIDYLIKSWGGVLAELNSMFKVDRDTTDNKYDGFDPFNGFLTGYTRIFTTNAYYSSDILNDFYDKQLAANKDFSSAKEAAERGITNGLYSSEYGDKAREAQAYNKQAEYLKLLRFFKYAEGDEQSAAAIQKYMLDSTMKLNDRTDEQILVDKWLEKIYNGTAEKSPSLFRDYTSTATRDSGEPILKATITAIGSRTTYTLPLNYETYVEFNNLVDSAVDKLYENLYNTAKKNGTVTLNGIFKALGLEYTDTLERDGKGDIVYDAATLKSDEIVAFKDKVIDALKAKYVKEHLKDAVYLSDDKELITRYDSGALADATPTDAKAMLEVMYGKGTELSAEMYTLYGEIMKEGFGGYNAEVDGDYRAFVQNHLDNLSTKEVAPLDSLTASISVSGSEYRRDSKDPKTRLTQIELNEYNETSIKTTNDIQNALMKSNVYDTLTTEEKLTVLQNAKDFGSFVGRVDFADGRNINAEIGDKYQQALYGKPIQEIADGLSQRIKDKRDDGTGSNSVSYGKAIASGDSGKISEAVSDEMSGYSSAAIEETKRLMSEAAIRAKTDSAVDTAADKLKGTSFGSSVTFRFNGDDQVLKSGTDAYKTYKSTYTNTANNTLTGVIGSGSYKALSDSAKESALNYAYTYAANMAQKEYIGSSYVSEKWIQNTVKYAVPIEQVIVARAMVFSSDSPSGSSASNDERYRAAKAVATRPGDAYKLYIILGGSESSANKYFNVG